VSVRPFVTTFFASNAGILSINAFSKAEHNSSQVLAMRRGSFKVALFYKSRTR